MGILGGTSKTELGDQLRDERNARSLTQAELADMLDVTTRTIQHWEAGTRTPGAGLRHLVWLELGLNLVEESEFDHEQKSLARELQLLAK
jgi:transcriptional regulator with XRE-family HTH domain